MRLTNDPFSNTVPAAPQNQRWWQDRLTLAQSFELYLDLSPLNCASRLHGLARPYRNYWTPCRRVVVDQTGSENCVFKIYVERRNRGRAHRGGIIFGVISRDYNHPHITQVSGKSTVQLAYLIYASALVAVGLALLRHPYYVFAIAACLILIPWVASVYLDNRSLIAAIKRELTAQDL